MSKVKMGRPRIPYNEKGRVLTFYAPKELVNKVDLLVERSNKPISEFLRDAVTRALQEAEANQCA